jgi:uncharacterized protein YbjT (DUF2867 family)
LLDQGGHELILLARTPDKLKEEQAKGAKIVQGDLEDAAYVKKATQGADAFFFLCPPNFSVPDYRAYYGEVAKAGADAVKANRIKHTVLLSSVGAHLPEGTGPILGLYDAERRREDFRPGHAGPDHPAPRVVHGKLLLAARTYQAHEQHLRASVR